MALGRGLGFQGQRFKFVKVAHSRFIDNAIEQYIYQDTM